MRLVSQETNENISIKNTLKLEEETDLFLYTFYTVYLQDLREKINPLCWVNHRTTSYNYQECIIFLIKNFRLLHSTSPKRLYVIIQLNKNKKHVRALSFSALKTASNTRKKKRFFPEQQGVWFIYWFVSCFTWFVCSSFYETLNLVK